MDKIAVSTNGLREAYKALQEFREQTNQITATFEKILQNNKDKLDEGFQKDMQAYLEELRNWNSRVTLYTQQNHDAITERMYALSDYCSATYTKPGT